MPAIPKQENNFQPCTAGTFQGVLVDIVDMGHKEAFHEGQSKGLKPRIQLVWMVDELNDEGKPFLVFERVMKLSSSSNSALYGWMVGPG